MFVVFILFGQFVLALSYARSEWSPSYGAIILARNREQDRTSVDPKFIS